jgi:hypothetical protein
MKTVKMVAVVIRIPINVYEYRLIFVFLTDHFELEKTLEFLFCRYVSFSVICTQLNSGASRRYCRKVVTL